MIRTTYSTLTSERENEVTRVAPPQGAVAPQTNHRRRRIIIPPPAVHSTAATTTTNRGHEAAMNKRPPSRAVIAAALNALLLLAVLMFAGPPARAQQPFRISPYASSVDDGRGGCRIFSDDYYYGGEGARAEQADLAPPDAANLNVAETLVLESATARPDGPTERAAHRGRHTHSYRRHARRAPRTEPAEDITVAAAPKCDSRDGKAPAASGCDVTDSPPNERSAAAPLRPPHRLLFTTHPEDRAHAWAARAPSVAVYI